MSVPEPQRGKGKLEVCTKARDLANYTLQITSNEKKSQRKKSMNRIMLGEIMQARATVSNWFSEWTNTMQNCGGKVWQS